MKKGVRKLNSKKWFKFIFIPASLLALWVGLTLLYILTFDTSFSVISYNHGKENFDRITHNKLLKGDKISGSFAATEDNLGIISVKFQTFIRPPYRQEDRLVFRLKEKGERDWYYENTYRVGLIYDMPFFPFGFPIIQDSKNKIYYFEIESVKGNDTNSVALSNKGNTLTSKYQASKTLLLQNKKELAVFSYKKFLNSMSATDVRFSSFIYLLPFIFYILRLFSRKKKRLIHYANYVVFAVVLADIFIFQLSNDVMYLTLIPLWVILNNMYKLRSKISFLFAFLLLLLPPLLLSFRNQPTAEKAAIWAYMFLIAGTIQILIELRSTKKTYEKN